MTKKYFGYILTGIPSGFKITYCSAGRRIDFVPGCKVYHPPKTAGAERSGFCRIQGVKVSCPPRMSNFVNSTFPGESCG